MRKSLVLAINVFIYLLLGSFLILISTNVVTIPGVASVRQHFLITLLGAMFIGIAIALLFAWPLGEIGTVSLGLAGAACVSIAISIAIISWIIWGIQSLSWNEIGLMGVSAVVFLLISTLDIVTIVRFSANDEAQRLNSISKRFSVLQAWLKKVWVQVLLFLLILYGVLLGEIQIFQATILALFANLTYWFAKRFLDELSAGKTPSLESHWGGFGGNIGGWRMSVSLAFLLACIAFGILTVILTSNALYSGTMVPLTGMSMPTSMLVMMPKP